MEVRSRLLQQIIDVFLKREFDRHISRSRSRQRKDDVRLAFRAVRHELQCGDYSQGEPEMLRPRGGK